MDLRKAPQAVGREELLRIEDAVEQKPRLIGVHYAKDVGGRALAVQGVAHVLNHVGLVPDEPDHALLEVLERIDPLLLKALDRVQGHQAHEGSDPEFLEGAIGKAKDVVEEAVRLVEELVVPPAHPLHGRAHIDIVLEELGGEALVGLVLSRKLEGDAHEVQAEHAHPAGGVGLFEHRALRQLLRAIDDRDVVEAKEAAFEYVVALAVDLVHPPGEIDQQFVETLLQEHPVALALAQPVHVVDPPHRPGLHRRVQVRELPLVGRDLPGWMLKLLEEQQPKLFLCELAVDERERHAMEREVPRGEPRILPFVRHRHDAHRVEVPPVRIADLFPRLGRRPVGAVALQPHVHIEEIDLLGPEHPREGLTLDPLLVLGGVVGMNGGVELIGLGAPLRNDGGHGDERIRMKFGGEAKAKVDAFSRGHDHSIVEGGFRAGFIGIRGVFAAHHVAVESVLRVGRPTGHVRTVDRLAVGLVVGEEHLSAVGAEEVAVAEPVLERQLLRRKDIAVIRGQADEARPRRSGEDPRLGHLLFPPAPGVSKPEVGQDVEWSRLGAAVVNAQAHHDVLRVLLGILDFDVEVPVIVEDARVEEFVLRALAVSGLVLPHQLLVGELALGVLVEPLHVRVSGQVVEVEVVLLHVLAVVSLAGHHAVEAFLEERILLVPEGEGEAEHLIPVADAGESVLTPTVGLGPGLGVREIGPGVSVARIVLADRAPGALRNVRAPVPPRGERAVLLGKPIVFTRRRGHLTESMAKKVGSCAYSLGLHVLQSHSEGLR